MDDPRHTVIRSVINGLTSSDHEKLASHDYIIRIRYNPVNKITNSTVIPLSKTNIGDWYESCISYRPHITGYFVFLQVGHLHDIIEYVNDQQINMLSLMWSCL